jgi:hypothetical protein
LKLLAKQFGVQIAPLIDLDLTFHCPKRAVYDEEASPHLNASGGGVFMRFNQIAFRVVLCAVPILWAVVPARADFMGRGWVVSGTVADNAIPGNVPGTPPDFTFTASAVDFSSFGNLSNTGNPNADYTVNTFLNSLGSATSITDTTAGIGSLILAVGPGGCGLQTPICYGILFEITGMAAVTSGQTFTVAHDDGLTFTIGGNVVVNAPGPTPPTTTVGTYSGPTGNEPFQIVYGECCGGPAVLETTLTGPPPSVPEPSTIALFGTGLLGLGGLIRRQRKGQ